jgi:hypothetical protein
MRIRATKRLTGILTNHWTENDGVDVILCGTVTTRNWWNGRVIYAVRIAVAEDDVPGVVDALDQEAAQIGATGCAIDDHDEAVMRRAS